MTVGCDHAPVDSWPAGIEYIFTQQEAGGAVAVSPLMRPAGALRTRRTMITAMRPKVAD